jgi:cation-transporting ATPase 13A1
VRPRPLTPKRQLPRPETKPTTKPNQTTKNSIYSLFTLGMLVVFECTVVFQRLRNLKELRALQTPKPRLFVFRAGQWERLPGEALLPGDLVSIVRASASSSANQTSTNQSPTPSLTTAAATAAAAAAAEQVVVPADCLLLRGGCICEEAVLTGESTPQWKVSLAEAGLLVAGTGSSSERLHVKAHKSHVLFGGTRVLQHSAIVGAAGGGGGSAAAATGGGEATTTTTTAATTTTDHLLLPKTPDGGCLALVLRTGFETAQGRLVRTILHSTERVTANSFETGAFILFLLCFAVLAAWHVLSTGLRDPERDRFKLLLNCVMIVTSVIPPELPMELTIAVNTSLVNLARRSVFCTEPFRIPLAGRVDVACFDKTGTLTSDQMVLEGLSGVELAQGVAGRAVAARGDGGGQGRGGGSAGARRRKGGEGGGGGRASPPPENDNEAQQLAEPSQVPASVAVVLAACQ